MFPLFVFLFFIIPTRTIYYTSIIQLVIKKDPSATLEDYATLVSSYQDNPIVIADSANDYNTAGLNIYHPNKDRKMYEDLQFEIGKKLLEETNNGVEGITVLYRGYEDLSDEEGRILLPRFDYQLEFPIIITQDIYPVFLNSNIPDHFVIFQDNEFEVYWGRGVEIMSKDQSSQIISWEVAKIDSNEKNNYKVIPQNAIVILADPQNVFFSSEFMQMDDSFNVILPPLFIKNTTPEMLLPYQNLSLQTLLYHKNLIADSFSSVAENITHEGFRIG